MIDQYWLDKSAKRKSSLLSFCKFCDLDYCVIINRINTRWLTLKLAVEWTLLHYESLKFYFLSKNCTQDIFKRLRDLFEGPKTEAYLLFFQEMLPTLTYVSIILQLDELLIHVLKPLIHLCQSWSGSPTIPGTNASFSEFCWPCYRGWWWKTFLLTTLHWK